MIVGIVLVVVGVVIALDMIAGNRPPTIIILSAEPSVVLPYGSSNISCVATDRDGDQLSYNWSASEGTINGEGAEVTWKAPAKVGSCSITVTVSDGRGGTVTGRVVVAVRTNRPPVITNLKADADWTLPSGSLRVTCSAEDYDKDTLKYEWSASQGSISGAGAIVNWTAPREVGLYNITVVVKDIFGSSDTRTLPITVVRRPPPIIEKLEITKDRYGHCYLKEYSGGYYVGKGQKYDIECTASHPEGLEISYDWKCDRGEISGEGSMITWTAPDTDGKVTITVIVADMAGDLVSKNMNLFVVECSPCTFQC